MTTQETRGGKADTAVTRFAEQLTQTIGAADATMVLDGLKRVGTHMQARPVRDQLTRAGNAATARMLDAEDDVVALAARECTQDGSPPSAAPVDRTRLKALRAAKQSLEGTTLKQLTESLAKAQALAETGD
jgi:hypothetical protein